MLPAELRGTQVLSGCINADVKEDKNKRDYLLPPPQSGCAQCRDPCVSSNQQ